MLWDKGKPQEKAADGNDLISLLAVDQRAELTLLIATATETMRDALLHSFDELPQSEDDAGAEEIPPTLPARPKPDGSGGDEGPLPPLPARPAPLSTASKIPSEKARDKEDEGPLPPLPERPTLSSSATGKANEALAEAPTEFYDTSSPILITPEESSDESIYKPLPVSTKPLPPKHEAPENPSEQASGESGAASAETAPPTYAASKKSTRLGGDLPEISELMDLAPEPMMELAPEPMMELAPEPMEVEDDHTSPLPSYDDTVAGPVSAEQVQNFEHFEKKPHSGDKKSHDEKVSPSPAPSTGRKKSGAQKGKDLPSPELVKLKEAAVSSFDSWREGVLSRIGEVVNSPSDEKEQAAEQLAPPETKSQADDEALAKHYPPIQTPLTESLRPGVAETVLQAIQLLLLSLENYDARSRVLLLYIASSLHVPLSTLIDQENQTADLLLKVAENMSADTESAARVASSKNSKRWKVGIASVAGAVLIGVTGGLAAPFVAAGIGTMLGGIGLGAAAGYLGAVASSGALMGALFGAYGGRMTGKMMERYASEVSDFKFVHIASMQAEPEPSKPGSRYSSPPPLPPRPTATHSRLRVAIGITGWLVSHKSEITRPWRSFGRGLEAYALRWEVAALLDLGKSLETILSTAAFNFLRYELLKRTVFATMYAALWPIGLVKAAGVIDNPFSIAKIRSDKAGLVLADALINRAQGKRPVTLVGFSLGARVIYACLLSLAERKAFGIVENVVLIGAAVPAEPDAWRRMRAAVAGRLVNVYADDDYILAFLYRTSAIQLGVAGLQRIRGIPAVESVDVSRVVDGHLKYARVIGHILQKILPGDVDAAAVEKELARCREQDEREIRRWQEDEAKGLHPKEEELQQKEIDAAVEKARQELEQRRWDRALHEAERDRRNKALDHANRPSGGDEERPRNSRIEVRRKEVPGRE